MLKMKFLLLLFIIEPIFAQVRFSNHGITVQVDEESGRFNMGRTSDDATLIFAFPSSPGTSNTNFLVDGILYSNRPSLGVSPLMTFSPAVVETSIICRWNIAGVDITQRLTPVPLALGLGSLFIQYHIVNRSSFSHTVGVLLQLDTMIRHNDAAPIATEYGYANVAQEFYAPNIPRYWQAFEIGPDQGPEYLIGQGVLYGWGATMPDRFAVGWWPIFVDIAWDATPSELGIGSPYTDSSVLIWWYPMTLARGESTYVATYYGLGSMEVVIGVLSLRLLVPAALSVVMGEYSPNPFDANLSVINAGREAVHNVTATISLPAGLELISPSATVPVTPSTLAPDEIGQASWQIRALDQPRDTVLCINVVVEALDAESNSIFRCISIPMIDRTPPSATIIEPLHMTISSNPRQRIRMLISDPNGIDQSTIELLVNGIPYTRDSLGFRFTEPELVFTPRENYLNGDTVELVLRHARDNYYNDIREPVSWAFISDQLGPEASELFPLPGSVVPVSPSYISARITDNFTPIDSLSLLIMITTHFESNVYPIENPALVWTGDYLFFYPESIGISFIPGDTINVQILRADDMPNYGEPNPFQLPTGQWRFFIADEDSLPPVFSEFEPDTTYANREFFITVMITDESGIYIDTGSAATPYLLWDNDGELSFTYNIVRLDSIPGSLTIDTATGRYGWRFITSEPIPPQVESALFVYRVFACDNDFDLDNPNDRACTTSELHNVVFLNTTGPEIELLTPYNGAYSSCTRQQIRILIYDPQGVDRTTIELFVMGTRYDISSPEISYNDSILTFTPSRAYPEGRIDFGLGDVSDRLGNVTSGRNWWFISDKQAPELSGLTPSAGSLVEDFSPIIAFSIDDSLSGVDTSSIYVQVGARGFRVGDRAVSFELGSFSINTGLAGMRFADDELVDVTIRAKDKVDPQFCPQNELVYTYKFKISSTPCKRTPNPITPNGDGKNDFAVFTFPNMRQYKAQATIEIFELNGKIVRRINSFDVKDDKWIWDGKDMNGEDCRQGIYVYLIKVKDEVVCSGTISIAR